jgi:glucose/arabinose dehydrogenase
MGREKDRILLLRAASPDQELQVYVHAARSSSYAFSVLALSLAVACGGGEKAPASNATTVRTDSGAAKTTACAGGNAELTLPAGFCATVFADSIASARHVTVASNGDVYTTIEGFKPPDPTNPNPGPTVAFVAMRDTNHDGHADVIARVNGKGNTGIGLFNGYLYVDEGTRVVRYARADSQLVPNPKEEVVIDRIPLEPGHRARNFVIAPDSTLYLNVGSATNSCQVKDRGDESPGHDPCTETATRAGTWRFSANKLGQHFSPAARFATGIRNGMGLDIGPNGKLYGTQHGRDQFFQNWKRIFPDPKYSALNPAEELLQIDQGDDFGWPYCYYSVDEKKLVTAPEYGGDGKKTTRCETKKEPVATYPGHWAPMSLMFYRGTTFPARYRDGAFIAFHGSWNRAPEQQEGYRVVFQPMTNGAASGQYEDFATGFAGVPPAQVQPGTAKHRPVGLATAPDGALFITDDQGGRIYRVAYGAGK